MSKSRFWNYGFTAIFGFAVAMPAELPAQERTVAHNTKIQISLLGIPVGKLKLYYSTKNGAYNLTVFAETSGISRLISDAKAKIISSGTNADGKLQVEKHSIVYNEGDYHVKRSMTFKDGNVVDIKSVPPVKMHKDTVPLLAKHSLNVVDAASSGFISVTAQQIDNGPAICNRTLRLFDGETRVNIRLQYKGARPIDVPGYKGRVFICSVQYEPIAGHRTGKKHIQYMTKVKDIELGMARIGTTAVYSLIQFSIPSPVGKITGKAYKFVTELR